MTDVALPPSHRSTGLVAIVDALGTADYSHDHANQYLVNLEQLLNEITRFAEDKAKGFLEQFREVKLQRLVFQDSVILFYESKNEQPTVGEIVWFGHVLRTFEGGALGRNLLFRGAFAWGEFYVAAKHTNIDAILGPAVRDAARWYDRADWIGIHATPRTSIIVQSLLDAQINEKEIDFVLANYEVPMKPAPNASAKTSFQMKLRAVNWPKNLHLRFRDLNARHIRGFVQQHLTAHEFPSGTEQKHFNALAFFDEMVRSQKLSNPWTKTKAAKG
jgi:hypothetical protein